MKAKDCYAYRIRAVQRRYHIVKAKTGRICPILGVLALLLLPVSAHALSLKKATSNGTSVTGSQPGTVLWTDYAVNITDPESLNLISTTGDNIIRLINPNGSANGGLPGQREHTVCAMIYVFDSFQEMQECCGCPVSSAGFAAFSVANDLTDNKLFTPNGTPDNGSIAIVAAADNEDLVSASGGNGAGCLAGQSAACNQGCDPTSNPGYFVSSSDNLLGSRLISDLSAHSLTEIPLHDDADGDAANLTYLQAECGALVGNGSGAGFCFCPLGPADHDD